MLFLCGLYSANIVLIVSNLLKQVKSQLEFMEMTEHLKMTWRAIMQDKNHHIIVKKLDGKIVSSCVCDYS